MSYKFSIIVPIYKVEQYLHQCIDSIIHQSYQDIEIILVDDGSPDNCPEICDYYSKIDQRIKVIHKKNGGLVSARKAGAMVAKGDYVCCVDGDDYLTYDYVEKFAEIAEQQTVDIICCGYILTSNRNKVEHIISNRKGFYSRTDIENEIFPSLIQDSRGTYFLPTLWGKAIRRELYMTYQMQVDDRISMGEDGACTVPCIIHSSSIYILPDCLYYYRYNDSSMTKGRKPLNWEGQLMIKRHLENCINIDEFDFKNQLYRRIAKGFFSVAISQFNRKESYAVIKKDIQKHIKIPEFAEAIENAQYSGLIKIKLMDFALKKNFIFFIWILHKMR